MFKLLNSIHYLFQTVTHNNLFTFSPIRRVQRGVLGALLCIVVNINECTFASLEREDKKDTCNKQILKGEVILPSSKMEDSLRRSFASQWLDHCFLREKIFINDNLSWLLGESRVFGAKDLIVFDVDLTLIALLDPYYEAHYIPNTNLHQEVCNSGNGLLREMIDFSFLKCPWCILEPQVPNIISFMQGNGTKLMALTAMQLKIEKHTKTHMPKKRVSHLRKLGFDFSKSAPPLLRALSDSEGEKKIEPYFREGIIFSGSILKGQALLKYLHAACFRPKKVLFVDDCIENVLSVYKELTLGGIDCTSVLYTKAHNFVFKNWFNEEEFYTTLRLQENFLRKQLSKSLRIFSNDER